MTPSDKQRLRQLLDSFDELALTALANKGLVRRASKDLESDEPNFTETPTAILVEGKDWSVTMPPEGPTKATDSSKATGVTRFILMATMALAARWEKGLSRPTVANDDTTIQSTGPTPETPSSVAKNVTPESATANASESHQLLTRLQTIDRADLEKWATKSILNELEAVLPLVEPVVVVHDAALSLKIPSQDLEARAMPYLLDVKNAALLDGILVTGPKSQHRRSVSLLVMALARDAGRWAAAEQAVLTEALSTVPKLLLQTGELLAATIKAGLAHVSSASHDRYYTLSVAALACGLPRLGRLLRSIADDIELTLNRHIAADSERLLSRLTLAAELVSQTRLCSQQLPKALVGEVRSEYRPIVDRTLVGVGCSAWTSASGFRGLTTYFWDAALGTFLTWTFTLPKTVSGGSPEKVYESDGIWPSGSSVGRLSRSVFRLLRPKLNGDNRLSGSKESAVTGERLAEPADLRFDGREFDDWSALASRLNELFPLGLADMQTHQRLLVLRPASWGPRVFEELTQELIWTISDSAGRSLRLAIPWTPVNESAVEFVESVKPERDKLTGVFVRVHLGPHGFWFELLTFLSGGTPKGDFVLNPHFDALRIESKQARLIEELKRKQGKDRLAAAVSVDDGDDEAFRGSVLLSGFAAPVHELWRILLAVAESGLGRWSGLSDRATGLASTLGRTGFVELENTLRQAVANPSLDPASFFRLTWLAELHTRAASLLAARRQLADRGG